MENSYTETSPLFSSAFNNNKQSNNGIAATITRMQKECFGNSIAHHDETATSSKNKNSGYQNEIMEEIDDTKDVEPEEIMSDNSQQQRRALLEALIKALRNFTSSFSEEEDAEVVTAVIRSHLNRFPPSKSYDSLSTHRPENVVRASATMHSFITNNLVEEEEEEEENITEQTTFLSPISAIKSPLSNHSSSEQDSSTSEKINALKNSPLWQQWSSLKKSGPISEEQTRESLTMLLIETSDEEDVIYL